MSLRVEVAHTCNPSTLGLLQEAAVRCVSRVSGDTKQKS